MLETWRRLKAWFRKSSIDADLAEEMRQHVERRVEENVARGMDPVEARRQALLRFGNPAGLQEQGRAAWGISTLESLFYDVRYALRMMRKAPAFTAVVVMTLALGIGVNTAIFSAISAVMLRLLPVEEPQQLVLLTWTAKDWPRKVLEDLEGSSRADTPGGRTRSWSFSSEMLDLLRERNQVFSAALAFAANDDVANVGLGGHGGDAVRQGVSGDFFSALGVQPVLGRAFVPQDDQPGAPPVAVLSYGFWTRRMGRDPDVVGRSISVNGSPVTVVGIAPPEFFGVQPDISPELWVPLEQLAADIKRREDFELRQPKVWWVGMVGRLKPGVSQAEAQAQLDLLFRQKLVAADGKLSDDDLPRLELLPAARGLNTLRRQFSQSLLLLMAMVAVVLLIACANVAGLLLSRATARRKEIAIRVSLGAPRWRIIRQLLTESVLLALLGAAFGLVLARWTANVLMSLLGSGRTQAAVTIQLDWRVLAFTAAVAVACGLLFGLAPALRATRPGVFADLKQVAAPGGGQRRFAAGKYLVAAQVALSVLLVIFAGLLVRTLRKLQAVDLGFERENLLSFRVQPGSNNYDGPRLWQYYAELQRRLAALPGVERVTLTQLGPIDSGQSATSIPIPGYTEPGKPAHTYRHWIGPDYFSTLRLPIVLGRPLGEQDTASAPLVVIVNRKFMNLYMRGENPLGHTIQLGKDASTLATIVGVCGDAKYGLVRGEAPPTMYLSYLQRKAKGQPAPLSFMTYLVRTRGDVSSAVGNIEHATLALDKDVPLIDMHTEQELVNKSLFLERTFALLSASFGGLALLLASVGLYGRMAYAVTQRVNEIGIRMALGARPAAILQMFLRDSATMVAAGTALGVPVTLLCARLLEARLYEISAHDPQTIALAVLVLLGVTLAAGFLPARRAARVDPMVALRHE